MLNEFRSTNLTWDKATSRIYSPVTANESDENGRKLVVQIVNSGQVEDLTGATLHLYWITRDKLHDGLDVFKAVDLKKGEFELSYTTGMLSNKGVLNANLVLIDNVGRVVSERFKITVTEGIDNGAIQSENSFSSLTQALIDISNLEQNYAPRLNNLTAQLQHKANKDEVTNIMTPKGNKLYNSLPTTGNAIGDYYYSSDGDGVNGAGNYVWNGTVWYFGGTGDEGYNKLKEDLDNHEAFINGGIAEKKMSFELNQNKGFDYDGNESGNGYWSTGIQKFPDGAKSIHYKGTVYAKSILYIFDENKSCILKFGTFEGTGTEEKTVDVESNYAYFAVQTNSVTQADAICEVIYNTAVEGLNTAFEGLNAGKVDIDGIKQVTAKNIEFVDRKSNNIFDNTKYFIGYMWQASENDFVYNDAWSSVATSDFIQVDNTMTLRTLSIGYRGFTEYDENKNILRRRDNELSADTPVTLNSDVSYIRFSFDKDKVNSEMLYQSNERLYEYEPYDVYKIDKNYLYETDKEYNKLSTPHVFYKLKGYPLFIQNEQILLNSGKPLFASLGRNLNSIGGLYQTGKKSVYVNDSDLSKIYYEVRSDDMEQLIDIRETSFKVSDKNTDKGKIIIHPIGDSFTDINTQYKWIYDNIPNIEFVGLLKSMNTGLRHDGRTGRTLEWFCTVFKKNTTGSDASVSTFMHPINSQYKYYGTLNYWKYVKNSESFATIVDEIGIDTETGLRNNPNVNDLMYDGDNQTFIFWNGSSWENVSDETVGEFVFSYSKYLEVYGISIPNIVCIQLGTNDYNGYKREDVEQKNSNFANYLETMVSSIHDVSSDIKIIICVPPKGSMKEEYAQGDRYRANLNMMDCRTTIIDNFDKRESENIYVVDSGASIDGYSDFGVIGEYSSDSDRYPSWSQGLVKDGTHVNQNGFEKIGQSIGACIQYIR